MSPFGLISLNQEGQCCHLDAVNTNKRVVPINVGGQISNEIIKWPNGPSGIAGGCVFVSRLLWNTIGGYKVFGVYAGDDAHLMLDCHTFNFSYQVAETISIVHPHDNDVEYQKWKGTVCQRDTRTGVKSNIDEQIKDADEFWKNRK